MTRVGAYFRSWGSALATSGLWVVIAAVAGVVFLMWIAGTGFLPTGKPSQWQKSSSVQQAPAAPNVRPAVAACQGRSCAVPPAAETREYEMAQGGYDAVPPEGACAEDGAPPWGAPIWKECGIRCMYERLRNGFCGPGCDYYYFRMKEYKPRRFYRRKPCYRVP